MKIALLFAVVFEAAIIAFLGWFTLNATVDRDGAGQMYSLHSATIRDLLAVLRVKPDVCTASAPDVARVLNADIQAVSEGRTRVAKYALNIDFEGGHIVEIEVIGVGRTDVCH